MRPFIMSGAVPELLKDGCQIWVMKKNLKKWDECMQYFTNFYFKNANSELNIIDFY